MITSHSAFNRRNPLLLRAEGLPDVDETVQSGFADESRPPARPHARLALRRGQEAQRAEGGPRRVGAGVGAPGEDAGVGREDERTGSVAEPRRVDRRKRSFGATKVLPGGRKRETRWLLCRKHLTNSLLTNYACSSGPDS